MKNKSLLLMSMLAGLITITSCGNTQNSKYKYNIEFFGWGSSEEQENFQQLVDAYNASQEETHVRYSATDSSTFMTSLKNKGNNLPDVFYMPDYNFMEWAQSGKLMAIDGEFEGAITDKDVEKVWDKSIDMYRYNRESHALGEGSLYGLPKDLGPYTLVYNKTMLEDVIKLSGNKIALPSSEDPMTFNEFSNYLKLFKESTKGTKYADVFGISSYEIMPAIYSNNTDFYNSTDQRKENVSDPKVAEAIQWIADLCLKDGLMPTSSQQTSSNGYQRFLSKGCLFTFMGPWDLKSFWNTIDFDFDVIPVAKGNEEGCESTAWLGSVAYCISNYSKSKQASLDFIKYLSLSEESSRMNYQLGQAMPNIVEMAETDWVNNVGLEGRKALPEHKKVFVDITKGTDKIKGKNRAAYFCPSNLPYDNLLDSLAPVWNGEKTAAEHLSSYKTKFQKDLDDAYYYF